MKRFPAACAVGLVLAVSAAWADPPKVEPKKVVPVGKEYTLNVVYEKGKTLLPIPGFDPNDCLLFRGYEAPDSTTATFLVRPYKEGKFKVSFLHVGEAAYSTFDLYTTEQQPDPNPPPKPDPKPPPVPVSSFRVIYVWESGTPLTAAQNSVINGLATAQYLDTKTTKTDNARGWRLYDKDRPTDKDTATWNALWGAVKPKVTAVPCVAVEVNGKVDIIPLGATPEAMIATFKTYLGEK